MRDELLAGQFGKVIGIDFRDAPIERGQRDPVFGWHEIGFDSAVEQLAGAFSDGPFAYFIEDLDEVLVRLAPHRR